MSTRAPLLTVVIPGYNEGAGVVAALDRTVSALRDSVIDFEIVFLDDASTDDTIARVEEVAARCTEVRVIRNEKNLGCGDTVLRGFSESTGELVMFNGVDLPFAPEDTHLVVDRMQAGADVVVVQRRNRNAYNLRRKVISRVNILVLRLILGSPYSDHNFVQCYRRKVLDDIDVVSRGVGTVTPELILKARRRGFRVEAITCEYHERRHGRSSITIADVARSARELPRLWRAVRGAQKRGSQS